MNRNFHYCIISLVLICIPITLNSQVGINTDSPNAMLDVNGDVIIRVANTGDATMLNNILVFDANGLIHTISADDIATASFSLQTDGTVVIGDGTSANPVTLGQNGANAGDVMFWNGATSNWETTNIVSLFPTGSTEGQQLIWDNTNSTWIIGAADGDTDDQNEIELPTGGTSGQILSIDANGDYVWIDRTSIFNANNGLTINSETIQLGGNLIQPTEITTDNANTLAITGLETSASTDQVVTVNPATGVLTKSPISNLSEQYQIVYNATNGQTQFNTPATISDINKVDVYRNGVRIGLTQVDTDTIELETGVVCFENDEIRIVQLN